MPGNRDADGDGRGSACPLEKVESDAPALLLLPAATPASTFSCVGVIDCEGLAGPLNVPDEGAGGCAADADVGKQDIIGVDGADGPGVSVTCCALSPPLVLAL